MKVNDMKKTGWMTIAAMMALPLLADSAMAGDVEAGKTIAEKKCTMCHGFGDVIKKKGKVGPTLEGGVMGKKAGQVAGFKYSKAMQKAAEDGLTWDDKNVDEFIASPKKFMKGTKMMAFPGLKTAEDRANVIAFLKTL